MLAHIHIGKVARRLRPAVYGIVLWCRNGQVILWIVSLQSGHVGNAHAAREEGVFAVCLLTAAPARIAKDVQIRGPEVQASHDARVSLAHILHVLDASLNANLGRHGVNSRCIEGGSQADRLGILGYALVDDSMESLAPPLVCGNIETRHRGRIVLHLRSLLGESHPVHEVGSPLFRRQTGVQIRRIGRTLSDRGLYGQEEGKRSSSQDKSLQHLGHAFLHFWTSSW